MAKKIQLPQMGESVDTGTVLSILVSKGDRVDAGQALVEIETDKATTEVPSTESGVVEEIHVQEGDEVQSGQLIVTLGSQGAERTDDEPSQEQRAEEPEAETAQKRERGAKERGANAKERSAKERGPEEEGVVEEEGAEEEEDDDGGGRGAEAPQAREAQTDRDGKVEPQSAARQPREQRRGRKDEEGRERGRSQDVRRSRSARERAPEKGKEREKKPAPRATDGKEDGREPRHLASPTVRKLARELGIDVDDVAGSGRGGRVDEGDVKAHVRSLLERAQGPRPTRAAGLPDFTAWGEVEREPMSVLRRKTAEILVHSWREIPQVTQFASADISDLDSFRERFRGPVEEAGGKLTLTAILIKLAAEAIAYFPRFNASVDMEHTEIVLKRFLNIGVAVDTEDGLLVPVLHDVDRKSLTQVAVELHALAERARERDLEPDDLSGASFTVTNLGGLGTTVFAPIVPWPQTAILAVGRAEAVLSLRDGEVVERSRLPLGLTYDHRCIDGADAARFLGWIAEVLEEPMRMTMEPSSR